MRSAALCSLFLFACGSPDPRESTTLISQSSLREAFAGEDIDIVGITIDPVNHRRFVLDSSRGLFELKDGHAIFVANPSTMATAQPPESAFTDVAALGGSRFALTARNDGYLLDVALGSLDQYFCYVPGEIIDRYPDEPIAQMTRSVTYDAESELMFAQPQTIKMEDNSILTSQIGQFALSGGEGFGWLDLDDEDFIAGAITMAGANRMLLGEESKLHVYDLRAAGFVDEIDLSDYGVSDIEAMTRDPVSRHVLLVDANSDELVELELR